METRHDAAATDGLGRALGAILPALERFLRFEGPDPARERSRWRPALDRPLPTAGVGRDATLAELADLVVANGLRVGHPGVLGLGDHGAHGRGRGSGPRAGGGGVAALVGHPGPVLSICCFRFRPAGWDDGARLDALNQDVLHGIRARGRVSRPRARR